MARLTVEMRTNFYSVLDRLHRAFPALVIQCMGYVGSRGQELLKRRLLSGQELNVRGGVHAVDRRGRRLLGHRVYQNGKFVKIFGYMLPLFEKRVYGRGRPIGPGKKILNVKLRGIMAAEMSRILKEYDSKLLQIDINKIDKKA